MIARRHLLAGEHEITVARRVGAHRAFALVDPMEGAAWRRGSGFFDRLGDIEAKRVGLAGGKAGGPLRRRQATADAGITRSFRPVRGTAGARDLGQDRRTAAEAGIDERARSEAVERCLVVGKMRRLAPDFAVPVEAEPGEVGKHRIGEFRAAARRIDVFEAEEKPPARLARAAPGEKRGMGMAEMEIAGWARREA